MVSENSNGPRSHNDYCDSLCQKEQSSAHFGFGPATAIATSTTSTSTTTDVASAAVTITTAATSTSVTMTISTASSRGKADNVGVPEGGAIGGKGKERHQEGQGRDSGSMVMVHGAMYSLDLVALICYSKIKMKLTGLHIKILPEGEREREKERKRERERERESRREISKGLIEMWF